MTVEAQRSSPARGGATPRRAAAPRAHPVLRRLFALLEERQLSWLLLRPPSNLAAPRGDLDILVASEHAEALREVAEAVGFVALPGWEAPPNLLLFHYDRSSNRWLVLDVVTSVLPTPPGGRLLSDLTREVLRDRALRGAVALPSEEDAFWLLLVHCLLDKGAVAPRHRRRLMRLAPRAVHSAVGRTVASAVDCSPMELADAVFCGRWQVVESLRPRLAAGLRRRVPIPGRMRALAARLLAAARRPLLMPRRRGVSVALIGPNGVGKSTVAAGLQRRFPLESRVIYMGLWKGADGAGASRAALECVARPLRVWRRHLLAQLHRARGRLIIFDRYVYDAELPARPPLRALKRPYNWLLAHAVPPPDVVVLLDVPGRVAYGRKQENPARELDSERCTYRGLASRLPNLELVDASQSADAVVADVTAVVWRRTAARWVRGGSGAGERELAAACALVPRILAGAPRSLARRTRGAVIESAELSGTGTAIVRLARAGERPCALIKMPLTADGAAGLDREATTLAALRPDPRLGDLRRLLPRTLARGRVLEQPYRVDLPLPGHSPLELVGDPSARRRLLEAAAESIAVLHEATASTVRAGDAIVERWVDAPLADLARSGAIRHPRFRGRAARLREELHGALSGRLLATSWVHGDYWLGNLLYSGDDLALSGIVDWDAAAPAEPPMHDLLHLVLSMRRLVSGEELGRIVRRQLGDPEFSPQERRILERRGPWPPDGFASERQALLLYWLRQVSLHARQHRLSRDHRYRLWEMRNVHAVLAAL
jgi:thymidylate kinase